MKNTTTLQSKRSITVLLGVLLYFSSLSAQTMQDTIIANFSLMERIPKEKLYLHLDKPFYGAGEENHHLAHSGIYSGDGIRVLRYHVSGQSGTLSSECGHC